METDPERHLFLVMRWKSEDFIFAVSYNESALDPLKITSLRCHTYEIFSPPPITLYIEETSVLRYHVLWVELEEINDVSLVRFVVFL